MSYLNNTLDTKPRAHSPSEGNVVDHHAPNGRLHNLFLFPVHNIHKSLPQVTDELPAGPKRIDPKATMIKVQPLKRSEMQVNLSHQSLSIHHTYCI